MQKRLLQAWKLSAFTGSQNHGDKFVSVSLFLYLANGWLFTNRHPQLCLET